MALVNFRTIFSNSSIRMNIISGESEASKILVLDNKLVVNKELVLGKKLIVENMLVMLIKLSKKLILSKELEVVENKKLNLIKDILK